MARPKTYLTETARISARRATWRAAQHRRRGMVSATASPTVNVARRFDRADAPPPGIAWVPNDTLKAILADVKALFPPAPLLRGGEFRLFGRRARVRFQPERENSAAA